MMSFPQIQQSVASELKALDQTILTSLESNVPVINQIGRYLIESGGKRARPLVVLLSASACGAKGEAPLSMAAIIEFIHTATLLHDDVVDGSPLRRGRPTANRVWDNATAVLVGDFLYSRAFQMMVTLDNMRAMAILSEATNVIAEGEVLQLAHRNEPNILEERYLKVIEFKTAKLFEAGGQLGAILAKQPTKIENALAAFGHHLGMAFQLVDDVLDYQAHSEAWGKHLGNDLAEGKATLPLIYAMQHSPEAQSKQLRNAIKAGAIEDLTLVQQVIADTGAIDYTMEMAQKEIDKALEATSLLPPSLYRDALQALAAFAITRGN